MNKLNWRDPKVKVTALGAAAVVAFALYRAKHAGGSAPVSSIGNPAGAASALGDANLQSAVYDSLESQYTGLAAMLANLRIHLQNNTRADLRLQQEVAHLRIAVRTKAQPASPKPPVTPRPAPSKLVPIAKATPIVRTPVAAVHTAIPTPVPR